MLPTIRTGGTEAQDVTAVAQPSMIAHQESLFRMFFPLTTEF